MCDLYDQVVDYLGNGYLITDDPHGDFDVDGIVDTLASDGFESLEDCPEDRLATILEDHAYMLYYCEGSTDYSLPSFDLRFDVHESITPVSDVLETFTLDQEDTEDEDWTPMIDRALDSHTLCGKRFVRASEVHYGTHGDTRYWFYVREQ